MKTQAVGSAADDIVLREFLPRVGGLPILVGVWELVQKDHCDGIHDIDRRVVEVEVCSES